MHAIRQEQQIRLGPYERQERWQCKTNSLIWFCHRKKQRINTVIVDCVHDFSDICGASKYSKNLPPPTGWAICLSWPRNRGRKLIILLSPPPKKKKNTKKKTPSKRVLTDELSSFTPQLYNQGIILFESYHDPFLWRNLFSQSEQEEWIMRRKQRRICLLYRRTHDVCLDLTA